MIHTETVFYQHRPLGQLRFNDILQVATFEPARDELRRFARKSWECPVAAREEVRAAAEELDGKTVNHEQ